LSKQPELSDGGEAAAVGGAGAVPVEGFEVGAGAVAFVAGEAVLGIGLVQFGHDAVAGDFGEDAGGGDGEAAGVAFDLILSGAGEAGDGQAVDEGEVGKGREGIERPGHGEVGGAEDIEAVDLLRFDDGDGGEEFRGGVEEIEELTAFGGGEFLGVVEVQQSGRRVVQQVRGEEDSGGDDGSGEGAAAGFIDPGNTRNAAPEKSGVFDGQPVGSSGRNEVR